MLDRLENAISMAQRRSTRVGVIFLDLDHFKQINDSLGHAVGDLVLQLATRRLEDAVRESDSVSRHGGDEFVVLLAEMAKPSDAAAVAKKIIDSLAVPAQVGPHTLSLSGSLGISIYPDDGADPVDAHQLRRCRHVPRQEGGAGPLRLLQRDRRPRRRRRRARRPSSRAPGPAPDSALAEHEARLRELLEANRHLVSAAQTAQKLQAHAEDAHQRQINFVAMAAHALRNPLSAIRMATATLRHPKADHAAARQPARGDPSPSRAHGAPDRRPARRLAHRRRRVPPPARARSTSAPILAEAVDACRHAIDAKRQRLRIELLPGRPASTAIRSA